MAQSRTEAQKKPATAEDTGKTQKEFESAGLTEKIIGAAIKVHKTLGPGYVEQVYQRALERELSSQGIGFEREKRFEILYEGRRIGFGVLDFMIEEKVVVEIKAVSELDEIHLAQALSYLKAVNKKVGLLLNFARPKLEIKRVIL